MDGEGPCLVVLGNVQGWGRVGELLDFYAYSRIICADGGQKVAARLGLRATDFIGDFDSSPVPAGRLRRADADGQILPEDTLDAPPADPAQATVYVLPAEKNVTGASTFWGVVAAGWTTPWGIWGFWRSTRGAAS